jgi:hypothetical protein
MEPILSIAAWKTYSPQKQFVDEALKLPNLKEFSLSMLQGTTQKTMTRYTLP